MCACGCGGVCVGGGFVHAPGGRTATPQEEPRACAASSGGVAAKAKGESLACSPRTQPCNRESGGGGRGGRGGGGGGKRRREERGSVRSLLAAASWPRVARLELERRAGVRAEEEEETSHCGDTICRGAACSKVRRRLVDSPCPCSAQVEGTPPRACGGGGVRAGALAGRTSLQGQGVETAHAQGKAAGGPRRPRAAAEGPGGGGERRPPTGRFEEGSEKAPRRGRRRREEAALAAAACHRTTAASSMRGPVR